MIKSELIAKIVKKRPNIPEHHIHLCVNELLKQMSEAISCDRRVEVRDFGTFRLHHLNPRNTRNPKTGERLMTPRRSKTHFKPGKELRERVATGKNSKDD